MAKFLVGSKHNSSASRAPEEDEEGCLTEEEINEEEGDKEKRTKVASRRVMSVEQAGHDELLR